MANRKISIIIITLNEEEFLERLLLTLRDMDDVEVIVSDGGSIDRTARVARKYTDRVIVGEKGRGLQLNAGAAIATGDILWFVHADSIVPHDFKYHILKALEQPGVIGGAFKLKIFSELSSLNIVSRVASLRSKISKIPYGDQGIFVTREAFDRVNGYKNIPLMEDVDFCRRLKKVGRLKLLKTVIQTCGRAWERDGVLRTTLRNWAYVTLFLMGYSPYKLYNRYYRKQLQHTMQRATIRQRKGWSRILPLNNGKSGNGAESIDMKESQ